jgi:two-component system OmpR family sensor kinase
MRGAVDVTLSQPRQADEYRQALLSVGQDVDRLQAITADLLVLARADAGRSPLENAPVRLDVVAREVVETLGGPAEGRRIALHVVAPEAVTVSGDERWLRQLVFNLVHNALKFVGDEAARPAAEVVVRVNSEPGDAVLSVSDNGPGIPEDKIPHIFERFYRADSARTRGDHGGAGLGLSIAAWIVSAHGGEIRVQNRVEGGCLFTIRLPLAESTPGLERA